MDDGGPARDMTLLDYYTGQVAASATASLLRDTAKQVAGVVEGSIDPGALPSRPFSETVAIFYYELAIAMVAEKRRLENEEHDSRDEEGATATDGTPADIGETK